MVSKKNGHAVLASDSVDNRILLLAAGIQKAQPKNPTILVSKDINLRIKADALGLQAEDYEKRSCLHHGPLHRHLIEISVPTEKITEFRAKGELYLGNGKKYFPNEYCTLTDESNPKKAALTKVDATGTRLVPITDCRDGVWGSQAPQP